MRLVNLTPHAINVFAADGTIHVIEPDPSGPARITEERVTLEEAHPSLLGADLCEIRPGEITGLPDPAPETVYIASRAVAQAAASRGRTDVVAPDTGRAIRDDQGRILGVPGFVLFTP